MDPNVTLKEIRELLDLRDAAPWEFDGHHGHRALDLLEALDRWISRGGCLPEAWQSEVCPECEEKSEAIARCIDRWNAGDSRHMEELVA